MGNRVGAKGWELHPVRFYILYSAFFCYAAFGDGRKDIDEGTYVLNVLSRTHNFPYYSLTVSSSAPTIQIAALNPANVFIPPHPAQLLPYSSPGGLTIYAGGIHKFKADPQSFNPIKLLMANPMMLLMVGGAAFVFLMPKLMGNLDPEALKEMQANQADINRSMASFQNIDVTSGLSSFLAGESSSAPDSSSRQGGGNKKRR
ncbi:hypothetical protein BT69DRAFT_1352942 [Atractiella rhizophila]|nr:hypothetical protein BT69DRAFT_1352942 [Atractiella rhizophila]